MNILGGQNESNIIMPSSKHERKFIFQQNST